MLPIVDLHCDLLCYLANDSNRNVYDKESRCGLSQLRTGNVRLQTLAIFTDTGPASLKQGDEQLQQFINLQKDYPKDFHSVKKNETIVFDGEAINVLIGIENASSFCAENEPLENFFKRLEHIDNEISKILYISLTWNLENRFGGGAHTKVGLKEDGMKLLNFLHRRRIAIDLSHTSDFLALEILEFIDAKNLDIPIVASHSNFRAITDVARNLSDELAKEIILRGGLIGFTFYKTFVGPDKDFFLKQLDYLIEIGGEKNICFGADFFCGHDLPIAYKKPMDQLFFEEFGDAGTYFPLLEFCKEHLNLEDQFIMGMTHQNFINFYQKNILTPPENMYP